MNERTVYMHKADAMRAFFKGKIDIKELKHNAEKVFGSKIAEKSEIQSFLKNKFMISIQAEEMGVSEKIITTKAKELMGAL